MGTMYIKYPWDTAVGQEVTKEQIELGQQIYDKVSGWCEIHALGNYDVDPTLYAKGLKVKFDKTEDTKALKAFMK